MEINKSNSNLLPTLLKEKHNPDYNSTYFFRVIHYWIVPGFTFCFFIFATVTKTVAQIKVAFSADIVTGCSPMSVAFSNESTPVDGSTYLWNFGNGNVSTARNPQSSYLTPGNYTVSLSVTNAGITETFVKENFIKVYSNPVALFEFTGDTIGCSPFNVTFNNLSSDPGGLSLSYIWSFGDGSGSMSQNPIKTYHTGGDFDVTLLVTNSRGCSNSFSVGRLIHVLKPAAQFGVNETYSCTGKLLTTFTNVSQGQTALTSFWEFGNGATSSQTSPVYLYQNPGDYTVKLTVTDQYGCANQVIRPNLIKVVKTIAKFNSSQDTICPNKNLTLTNRSEFATNYKWRLGDQTISTLTNVNKSYSQPGDYTIWLIAKNGLCKDSTSKKINVEYVKANFSIQDSFICELPKLISYHDKSVNATKWSWRFGNGSVSVVRNPEVNYSVSIPLTNNKAIFSDTLIVTSKWGCTDKIIKNNSVTVHLPNVKMSPGSGGNSSGLNVCIPKNITFTDKSTYYSQFDQITGIEWSYNSIPQGSGSSVSIDVNQTGKIPVELTVTTLKGCVHKKVEFINAGQTLSPDFTLDGNYEVCASQPVNFTITSPEASLITNSEWNFGDGATGMMLFPPHKFIKTGPMDVTLKIFNYGCSSSVTKTNIVNIRGPIVNFENTFNCATPFNRAFIANIQGATNYIWNMGDGSQLINNQNNINHTYPATGDFTVKLSATNSTSGCSYEFERVIFIRDLKSDYQVSAGTPCLNSNLTLDGSGSTDAVSFSVGSNTGKYQWNIKEENKTILTEGPLIHKFIKKGLNTVSLVVQDINGCKSQLSKEITIYNPEPDFDANYKLGCMPVTFEFTDLSKSDSPISKWLWNFGDSKTSTNQNPTHDYTNFGQFNVSLEITNEVGCKVKKTKNQLIKAISPDASFKALKTQLCIGDSTTLSENTLSTIKEYNWELGDGRTSTIPKPLFAFNEPGQFSVTLKIKDNHGCESTKKIDNFIQVQKLPVANFESDVTNSNCYPLIVQFSDKSENEFPASWQWHFGENNNISELRNPFFIYNRPGNHDVRLITKTTFGCTDTIVKPGFITIGGPYATISLPDTVCQKSDVIFTAQNMKNVYDIRWDFGDGHFGSGSQTIHQYTRPGFVYPVMFIRSDANNTCNKALIDTLSVFDLRARFSVKENIDKGCVPFGPKLINESVNSTSWKWEFGNGETQSNLVPQYQYTLPGNYNMRLIAMNQLGCRDTSTFKQITVHPLPKITVSNDVVICLGATTQLTAEGGIDYKWLPPETLFTPNEQNTIAAPDETTLYQVFVTDYNKCTNSDNILVSVQQIPFVPLRDTTLIIGETLNIDITNPEISNYNWSPPTYLTCTNCPNPSIQPMETTLYRVAVTDTSGCFTVNYPLKINILKQYSVDVPNAFTPNGDGINDIIFVNGWGIKEIVLFKIYNRLGQEVYSSKELLKGWDGTYKGKIQPVETYSYHVMVKTYENKVLTKSGTIKLLR